METKEHADTLPDLGVDIDELTQRRNTERVGGPTPNGINPEQEGPVSAPNTGGGS